MTVESQPPPEQAETLVLEALVRDPKRSYPQLADPLKALVAISRDPEFRWSVKMSDKRTSTAIEIQRALAKNRKARENFVGLAPFARKTYLYWINNAKRPETRAKRIAEVIDRLNKGFRHPHD